MKQRCTLVVLMLLICLSIFGQQPQIVSIQGQPQKTSTQVSINQQEIILLLQAENEAIQKQLEKMEREIELYRGDVRAKEVAINDNQGHWMTLLSIVIGAIVSILGIGLGVITPLVLNARNDKRLKDSYERMVGELKTQIDSVEKDAKSAKESLSTITGLKEDIDKIKNDIDKSKKAAERAAQRAIANKFFTQSLSEKEPSKQIDLLTKAIELNPFFAEAYNNRGYVKERINEKESALEDYNKAIELDPNLAEAYNNRGNVKSDLNDNNGAMKDYDDAIRLSPKYANAYNNRGNLKEDMGDKKGAMMDYNNAIKYAPDFAEAYCNRGTLKSHIRDNHGAMKDYQKAIEVNPLFYGAYLCKGLLEINIEEYYNAIEDFAQAIFLNANNTESYMSRAKCYRKLAEAEQDPAKKADLVAKAEADEKKAESLKKEDMA